MFHDPCKNPLTPSYILNVQSLDTICTRLLGNILAGKGVTRADEGVIRAGQNF